jgi:hypothetical protein
MQHSKWRAKVRNRNGKYKQHLANAESKFEARLQANVFDKVPEALYHPPKLHYIVEHDYTTDWWMPAKDNKFVWFEAKGMFETSYEASKYVWVRKFLRTNEELIFIFQNPHAEIYFRTKRKDGTKITLAQWADKNKFRWTSEAEALDFVLGERDERTE